MKSVKTDLNVRLTLKKRDGIKTKGGHDQEDIATCYLPRGRRSIPISSEGFRETFATSDHPPQRANFKSTSLFSPQIRVSGRPCLFYIAHFTQVSQSERRIMCVDLDG